MNNRQLEYFSHVYEKRNYTRCAKELFISKQALKKTIRLLEEEVGVPLFVDVANRLEPTKAADGLYRASRTAMQGFDEVRSWLESEKTRQRGSIRYACSIDYAEAFSRDEAELFLDVSSTAIDSWWPGRMTVVWMTTGEILKGFADNRLDYAHVILPFGRVEAFDGAATRTGRLLLVVRPEHPLSARRSVSLSDLEGVRLAMQEEDNPFSSLITSRASDLGVRYDVAYRAENTKVRVDLVGAGLALTYCFASDASSLAGTGLCTVPFDEPFLMWQTCIIAKRGEGDPSLLWHFEGKHIATWLG